MITIKADRANTFLKKTSGLIGKNKLQALLIKTRFGIHTFGLKFPIDVLILDKNNRIVCLRENLQPNRVFVWPPRYDTVVELPNGFIKSKHLQKHSIVSLSFE